jgi:hypothetical protein
MDSKFSFVADAVIRDKAYPALAEWSARPYTAEWRQFVQHWPHTVPVELHEHCATHGFPYQLLTVNNTCPSDSFYTIGLGFFNFSIDYFSLLSLNILNRLRQSNLRILFYYHEGDNPFKIKDRLDQLCQTHDLSTNCYVFVSGNTSADQIKNFAWFPDHELLYWQRNQKVLATNIHLNPRPFEFTALNRTHKYWRATAMSDLQKSGLLKNSQWSYNVNLSANEDPQDNPIEVDTLGLQTDLTIFLNQGPYLCDSLNSDQHNDHHLHVAEHYTQSYCHIVLETHFDADGSGGSFLTEKTFKPIKHGQPFVVVGPMGTLQALRDLGYRTFDHAIDNSYDLEPNNTLRWVKIKKSLQQIQAQDMLSWFITCVDDVRHNQQLFCSSKHSRLNTLYHKLLNNL